MWVRVVDMEQEERRIEWERRWWRVAGMLKGREKGKCSE